LKKAKKAQRLSGTLNRVPLSPKGAKGDRGITVLGTALLEAHEINRLEIA